jgi:hypothetical protein
MSRKPQRKGKKGGKRRRHIKRFFRKLSQAEGLQEFPGHWQTDAKLLDLTIVERSLSISVSERPIGTISIDEFSRIVEDAEFFYTDNGKNLQR